MMNEQAKAEINQLYMMLSEEKKKALDVLMAQADGDLISKNNAITSVCQWGTTLERTGTYTITVAEMKQTITDMLCELPSVDIPQDHDGCKDCVYQDNPQDAMPCRECKQNYMDKWKAKANKVGRCEDCKCFRKLPLRTDTVGKCIQHWGVCPPCDWYCADFEPQESEE